MIQERTPQDWRYWRNLLVFTLLVLCVGVLAAILGLSYRGAQFYLHPARAQSSPGETPAHFGAGYQDVTLTTTDGIDLAAWYTPTRNSALILVAHGYGAARSAEMHAFFVRHSYGVLSWDARAHGASEGETCTWGVREVLDVEAAVDFVHEQTAVGQIGAYGQSMGGATLIEAAAVYPQIEALVADSAFTAIEEMLVEVVATPLLRPGMRFFVRWETGLSPDDLRPVDRIGAISPRPVFILQGQGDAMVPPNSARRLYQAAGEPRQLWTEPGVGHVGLYSAYPTMFEQKVIGFFDRYLVEE